MSVADDISLLFATVGVATYDHNPQGHDDEENGEMTPQDDHAMGEATSVQLARMEGDIKSQSKEITSVRQSVEREIGRMAQALEKHAEIVTRAVESMKQEFMSKSEGAAISERLKKVETVVFGAVGMIVIAVFGALIGLVVLK